MPDFLREFSRSPCYQNGKPDALTPQQPATLKRLSRSGQTCQVYGQFVGITALKSSRTDRAVWLAMVRVDTPVEFIRVLYLDNVHYLLFFTEEPENESLHLFPID